MMMVLLRCSGNSATPPLGVVTPEPTNSSGAIPGNSTDWKDDPHKTTRRAGGLSTFESPVYAVVFHWEPRLADVLESLEVGRPRNREVMKGIQNQRHLALGCT